MFLCLGFAKVLCLFIVFFLFFCAFGSLLPMFFASLFIVFSFLCVFGSVLPMFYASLFFSDVSVSWFCQCSMRVYLYFSHLFC